MKKMLVVFSLVLFLTGCKNEVKCSLEKDEIDYNIKQEVTLISDKNGIVTSAETILTMTFENDDEAKAYYDVLNALEQKSELKLEKNRLIVKDSEDYSDNSTIENVKEQLKDSGYSCK